MTLSISVITPSFQQGSFIERTIQSVINQCIEDIDYVVCDGGSSDETLSILEKYSNSIHWVSESDKGQADAVNKGLRMTKGDIIAWINSDDIYYPQALSRVLQFFDANPSVLAVYGQADWIDELDNVVSNYPTQSWDYRKLTKECYLCQPAVFFRRVLVENLGDLNTQLHYCMDYELWLRYGQTVSFAYLPYKLAASRIYATNKTFGNRLAAHREANEMLYAKFGHSTRHWIFKYAQLELESDDSLSPPSLIWAIQFFILAIKKCCRLNQRATPIVTLKVLIYVLRRITEKKWPQSFDIEHSVSDRHS